MSLQSHPALQGTDPSGSGGQSAALQGLAASSAACRVGTPARTALAGKNVGLLCDDPSLEEALLAYRAAADLGAHVSLVRPRFTGEQELRAVPETAHMLGRLYDVVACVALPRQLVEALRSGAGVPVVSDFDIDARLRAAGTETAAIDPSLVASPDERLAQWENALASSVA